MKKILSVISALILSLTASAQITDDSKIAVSPVMPEYGNIPNASLNSLFSKLQRVISTNGLAESTGERFILTPRVDIIESGITSSGMMLMKLEVTFIIGDVVEDKIFGSAIVNTTGIGDSEEKCYTKAFQVLKPNHPALVKMFSQVKTEIISYYNENIDVILKDIDRMTVMGQYDEALQKALTIPAACGDLYMKCQDKALEIYSAKRNAEKEVVNKDGLILLQKARSAWSARANYESAEEALAILAQIDPYAECRKDADLLLKQITSKLRSAEQAQWKFTLKKYEDKLDMEKQKQADRTALLGALVNRFGKIDINIQKEKTSRWGFANKK